MRKKLINKIKNIVAEWGSFNINEVEHEECPVLSGFGTCHTVLIERINNVGVDITHYVNEIATDENNIEYEVLSTDMLKEVLRIAENYKVDCDKSFERSQN